MDLLRENPVKQFLRTERMPSIWCPGCGIGTSVNCFVRALMDSGLDPSGVAVVSGIGCTGRVAGYLNLDSFHTTHGRALPFATGLKLANPELNVVVYSGDGDLTAIGGNHFIHAARRNMDLLCICVNNLTYGMTGGQVTPTTPTPAIASTTPYGAFEPTFNLPHLAASSGASFVARWTVFHVRQLTRTIEEALRKKGFRFIEIISPCPTLFLRRNRLGDSVDEMRFYRDNSEIRNLCDTRETEIAYRGKIVVGKFVDKVRPTWREAHAARHGEALGDRFIQWVGPDDDLRAPDEGMA